MLTKTSIKKPYTVIVMIIVIAIVGGVAVAKMPLDLFPDMELPYMIVCTMSPGASSVEVEEKVTNPLEDNLRQVNNVKNVLSVSSDNVSAVIMELQNGTDLTTLTQDIQGKIAIVKPGFPSMTMEPIVMKLDPDMMPIMTLAVSKQGETIEESSPELEELKDKIMSVNGVASVSDSGNIDNNVLMQVNVERMLDDPTNLIINHLHSYVNNPLNPLPKEFSNLETLIGIVKKNPDFIDKAYNKVFGKPIKPEEREILLDLIDVIDNIKNNPHKASEMLHDSMNEMNIDLSGMLGENKDAFLSQFDSMITVDTIQAMLTANNFEMPAGSVSVSGVNIFVKVGEKMNTFEDLKHMPAFSIDLRQMALPNPKFDADRLDPTNPNVDQDGDPKMLPPIVQMLRSKLDAAFIQSGSLDQLKAAITAEFGAKYADIITAMASKLLYKDSGGTLTRNDEVYNYILGLAYQPIKVELRDFAYLYNVNTASKAHTIINGNDGMMLSIFKTPEATVTSVTNGVEKLLKNMNENEGINYIILNNQGEVTKFMISSIAQNLLLGALFAIIILLIFLRDWKPTVTVGMSIIVSLVTAFAVMYLCGVTLNLVSMGGLALSVGMLVDNSIVVIENIYRKRNEGVSPIKAAYEGTKQVAGAIMSSTITTVIVFLPIIFVEGIAKQIFVDLAITIAVSLFASLIVAITLVPMISSRMLGLKSAVKKESKVFMKMKQSYAKSLNFMLNKKWITITVVCVLFVASIVSVFFMDLAFLPNTDMEQIYVEVGIDKSKLTDNYNFDEIVSDVTKDINKKLEDKPYVKDKGIELAVGMNFMGFELGGGNINTYITLKKKPKIKRDKAKEELEAIATEIANDPKYPEGAVVVGGLKDPNSVDIQGMVNNFLDASQIGVNVYGYDIEDMKKVSEDLSKIFYDINPDKEGDIKVNNGLSVASQELKLSVDTTKASKYGLTTAQVFLQLMSELMPKSANANINFHHDIGSSDIYIYDTNSYMERWYRASYKDESGKVMTERFYFDKADDTIDVMYDKNPRTKYFELRTDSKEGGKSVSYLYTMSKEDVDGSVANNVFTVAKKVLTDSNGKREMQNIPATSKPKYYAPSNDMPVYYDNSRINQIDIVTHMLKVPTMEEMGEMMGGGSGGGMPSMPFAGEFGGDETWHPFVPSFMLMQDKSFAVDEKGNILYRHHDQFGDMIDNVNFYANDVDGLIRYNYTGEDVNTLKGKKPSEDINPKVPVAVRKVDSFNTINHIEGKRVIEMSVKSASIGNNKLSKEVQKRINDYMNSGEAPKGIEVKFVGQNEVITETFNSLILMGVLAVVFIYLVMVAQFQSLKSPFIIMLTIPLALTGSILTLLMAQMPISVFALVGIILLIGIVVNNGIVFVDYANKLREGGMPKREALIRTAQDRIRPILMTALTTICSMLFSVFDQSMGASAIKPMAVTVVGGLSYATLLTLFFVPIMYDIMNRKEKLAVIKFDDDKEEDIEAEMRLTKLNDVKEVMQESKTLNYMDEAYIAKTLPTETPMESYINEVTAEDDTKADAPPNDGEESSEVVDETKKNDPKVEDPKTEDPKTDDIKVEDQVEDNVVEEAKPEDKKVEDLKTDDKKIEDLKTDDIKVEDQVEDNVVEEAKPEDKKVEDLKTDDKKIEDLKTDDIKVEDPKDEDLKIEDPKPEDKKVEDQVEDNVVEDPKTDDVKVEDPKKKSTVKKSTTKKTTAKTTPKKSTAKKSTKSTKTNK